MQTKSLSLRKAGPTSGPTSVSAPARPRPPPLTRASTARSEPHSSCSSSRASMPAGAPRALRHGWTSAAARHGPPTSGTAARRLQYVTSASGSASRRLQNVTPTSGTAARRLQYAVSAFGCASPSAAVRHTNFRHGCLSATVRHIRFRRAVQKRRLRPLRKTLLVTRATPARKDEVWHGARRCAFY